ncbi:MAG: hypothetical protein J5858_09520, partial [Lentisphaeria bacterium]|nr:hypothetical protein [Lentisphaeria bacterium]
QGSPFDMLEGFEESAFGDVPAPDIPEFSEAEILANEKDLLGFYVSGHPVAKYEDILRIFSTRNIEQISQGKGDVGVRVGGMIKSVARKASKKDGRMFGIIQFEDLTGSLEVLAYARTYEEYKDLIHLDERKRELGNPDGSPPEVTPVFVVGLTKKFDEESSPVSITAESFLTLDQVLEKFSVELHVHLYEAEDGGKVRQLMELMKKHAGGAAQLILCVHTLTGETVFLEASSRMQIKVSKVLLDSLNSLLGGKRWRIKTDDTVPKPRPKFERPAWKKDGENQSGA